LLGKEIGIDLDTSTVLVGRARGLALEHFEVLKRNQPLLR
jgi:hypothetical protein